MPLTTPPPRSQWKSLTTKKVTFSNALFHFENQIQSLPCFFLFHSSLAFKNKWWQIRSCHVETFAIPFNVPPPLLFCRCCRECSKIGLFVIYERPVKIIRSNSRFIVEGKNHFEATKHKKAVFCIFHKKPKRVKLISLFISRCRKFFSGWLLWFQCWSRCCFLEMRG